MEPRTEDRRATRRQPVPQARPAARAPSPVPRWRRIVPALSISVMAMGAVYASVPFTFAGAVDCQQHGLSGATAAPGTPAGTIIGDMDLRCAEAGNSRIAVGASVAGLAAVLGLGAAFAPTTAEVNARRPVEGDDGNRVPGGSRAVPASVSR